MGENDRRSITIMAVGDIMTGCGYFHSLVGDSIPRVMNDPDRSLLHENVTDVLKEADLLFGNLECAVSEDFDVTDDGIPPRLLGPAESISMLETAGFDVLNIANNHILDHGPEYVRETTELLDSHGIDHIGNPLVEQDRRSFRIGSREVTFEGYYIPDPSDEDDRHRVVSSLSDSGSRDRLHVVSLHWGLSRCEHMHRPAPEQVTLARELIDRGVDVVLGHHSHTFQPVERYDGGIIAYSLGNFIFDMWREKNRKSGILKLVVDSDNTVRASILPTEQIDYQVRLAGETHIEEVQRLPVTWESTESYRTASKRVMRSHQLDVIGQLFRNFHRFPPGFHLSTFDRWMRKGAREIKEYARHHGDRG